MGQGPRFGSDRRFVRTCWIRRWSDDESALHCRVVLRCLPALQRKRLAGAAGAACDRARGGRHGIPGERPPLRAIGSGGDRPAGGTLALDWNHLLHDVLRFDHAGRDDLRKSLHRGGGPAPARGMAERHVIRACVAVEHRCRRGDHRVRAASLPVARLRLRSALSRGADVRCAVSDGHLHVRRLLPSSHEHSSIRDRDSHPLGTHWFIRRVWLWRARRLWPHRRRDHGDRRGSSRHASNECRSSGRLTMSLRHDGTSSN